VLTIRPEQFAAFDAVAEAAFVARLVRHLRDEEADEEVLLPSGPEPVGGLPDATLEEMVRGGIARAESYGLTWESSVTAFVVLMFKAAPNFDAHPLVRRVLCDRALAPDERIDALWERITEETWDAVEEAYDADAWGVEA